MNNRTHIMISTLRVPVMATVFFAVLSAPGIVSAQFGTWNDWDGGSTWNDSSSGGSTWNDWDGYYVDDYYSDSYYYNDNYYSGGYYGGNWYYGGYNWPTNSHDDYPVCQSFSASRNSLPAGGGSVTLSWDTKDADTVSISGVGSVSKDGSRSVYVLNTRTFVLTAWGDGHTVSCQTSVYVENSPTPDPDPSPAQNPRCDAFYASPSLRSSSGAVTLYWDTTHASNVSINRGVGSVSLDGSRSVHVTDTEVFTLTVNNGEGDEVTCTTQVTVIEDDVPVSHNDNDLSCDSFYASPSYVEDGEDFRLYWRTTDADSVWIDHGIGYVSSDGDIRIEADEDDEQRYVLTARNGNDEVTCSTYVHVDDDNDNNNDRPRCDLDASDEHIDEGDRVRLSWDNTRAEDIRLRDNHGEEYFDTRHSSSDRRKYDEDDDSMYVYPDEDTTFTLTVYNDEGTRTCRVEIEVDENGSVASASVTRTQQPLVAGIALSQVPYTGFEAGPLLTSVFYTLLALWGVAIAYILVIRKRPLFNVVGAAKTEENPAVMPFVATTVDTDATVEAEPETTTVVEKEETRSLVQVCAEEEQILLAPDAIDFINEQAETESDQLYLFNKIADLAKAEFPMEDGWIALDRKRIESLIS